MFSCSSISTAVGGIWRQGTELTCPLVCYSLVVLEASLEFSGTSVLLVDATL